MIVTRFGCTTIHNKALYKMHHSFIHSISKNDSSTKNACRSPIIISEANAVRSRAFIERNFNSADCKGSKWAVFRALSTNAKSQDGREGGLGGFNLLALIRNLTTKSCSPTDLPSMGSWWVEIAAT